MNATEEWLRYIESKTLSQRYHITGYSGELSDEESQEKDNETTKDLRDV